METAVEQSRFIYDIGIFLMAAIAAVVALHRFGVSPVLGYLCAGLAIGPGGFGLMENSALVRAIAEFGVVFLMFAIGLELSFDRLRSMRVDVFGLGGMQVAMTMAVLAGLLYLWRGNAALALVAGGAFAVSSTAVVLQVLSERGEIGTRVGRKAFAVLLFQDIAVVPLLMLVQVLAGKEGSFGVSALLALGQGIAALLAAVLIGRLVLRPLYRVVAATGSRELFVAVVILTVGGFAVIAEEAGFSLALGAFLAGLLVTETEFRQQVEMDIEPFKGLLLGLFFMTVGMGLDAAYIAAHAKEIILLIIVIGLLKMAVLAPLALMFRLSFGEASWLATLLAQIGEFAFVILSLGAALGVLDREVAQIFLTATGVSLALTPLLAAVGARLQNRIDGGAARHAAPSLEETKSSLEGHVVLAGYGRVGRTIARMLDQHKIAYIALDLNPEQVGEAFRRGYPVYYGNASRPDTLKQANIARAAAFVVTIDNPAMAARTVAAVRELVPAVPILARAHDAEHCRRLARLGAAATVLEAMEGSLQLGGRVLEALGTPADVADQTIDALRREDYREMVRATAPKA